MKTRLSVSCEPLPCLQVCLPPHTPGNLPPVAGLSPSSSGRHYFSRQSERSGTAHAGRGHPESLVLALRAVDVGKRRSAPPRPPPAPRAAAYRGVARRQPSASPSLEPGAPLQPGLRSQKRGRLRVSPALSRSAVDVTPQGAELHVVVGAKRALRCTAERGPPSGALGGRETVTNRNESQRRASTDDTFALGPRDRL